MGAPHPIHAINLGVVPSSPSNNGERSKRSLTVASPGSAVSGRGAWSFNCREEAGHGPTSVGVSGNGTDWASVGEATDPSDPWSTWPFTPNSVDARTNTGTARSSTVVTCYLVKCLENGQLL